MIARHGSVGGRTGPSARAALALLAAACASTATLAPGRAPAAAGAPGAPFWSPARTLQAACAPAAAPQLAFPSEGPALPTGPGMITWAVEGARCGPGAGAGAAVVQMRLGREAALEPARLIPLPGAPAGALAAVGTSLGRVAVAVPVHEGPGAAAELMQGRAGGLPRATRVGGAPLSLARAYLGDSAVATVGEDAIAVRVERHYESRYEPPRLIPIAPGRVTSLVATMDFRSDVLVAWQQNGSVYAHMLRASDRRDPTQRLGASGPDVQLQALVSDNDHGMVAWASTTPAGSAPAHTRIRISLSEAGVRFDSARTVASFADPLRLGDVAGSIALVRLSTENVLFAWTAGERGRYTVREAPAVFAGARPSALLSDRARESVLAGLAPGPAGEAVALWSTTARAGHSELAPRPQLWAARTFVRPGDRVGSRPAEPVAAPGAGAAAAIAVDPASDRAFAAWLRPGREGAVQYAVSRGAVGYRPHPPPATASAPGGVHRLRIAAGALAAVALVLAAVWALRRRRRQPAGG